MSRSVSLTFKQAVFAQETDEAFLLLVTIDHPDLSQPIRVTSDGVDTVSRGNTFVAFPFDIALPSEEDEALSKVRLTIDNVDRQIVQALRSISGAPSVKLEVVLASDPDTVEAGPFDFTLRSATYDALVVTGELRAEDILNEPFPAGSFTPAAYPGLF